MRYRLRTLLIILALAPPVLAGLAWLWNTPRAIQVMGSSLVIVAVAVTFAVARIAYLTKQR